MKLILRGKIINTLLLSGFFITFININAQSIETLRHKKYWYYKTRFNNDFIKIGTEDGASLPFNQRGWRDQPPPFINHSEQIKAGDVSAQLGIGVTTFRWTQKLRLTALSLTNEKSKQSLQFRI